MTDVLTCSMVLLCHSLVKRHILKCRKVGGLTWHYFLCGRSLISTFCYMSLILRASVSSCVHFYSPWVSSQGQRGWAAEKFSLHDHPEKAALQHMFLVVFQDITALDFHYPNGIFEVSSFVNCDSKWRKNCPVGSFTVKSQ